MSTVTVIARLVIREDAVEAAKQELMKLVEQTRQEAGCIEYRLHQDNADPAVFIFYENWETRDCLAHHLDSAHFKNYAEATESLITEKTVNLMTELG